MLGFDKKMKLTIYRLIFKCQPKQKLGNVQKLIGVPSASLLQNLLLAVVLVMLKAILNLIISFIRLFFDNDETMEFPIWFIALLFISNCLGWILYIVNCR